MGFSSDALLTCLYEDLSPYLSTEQFDSREIWPDATLKQYAAFSLWKSAFKKYAPEISKDANSRALEKFKAINDGCKDFKLQPNNSWDEVLIGELKRSIYEFWYPCGDPLVSSFVDLVDDGRTGPGASIGASGMDLYSKLFSSELTVTDPRLYLMYKHTIDRDPRWASAEEARLTRYGSYRRVQGSRLNFAKKTVDISRLICTEPSLNMFLQLGLGKIIERRLEQVFNIDLSSQPDYNRELARLGSIDNSFATIDLSSASDSISLNLLREILPVSFLNWLELLRSRQTEVAGEFIDLHVVSTMGNGYTFPLETMLFACVVAACYRARGIELRRNRKKSPGNFAVFGDDIICVTSVTRDVLRLLKLCGFSVNSDKTFVEGPFRESCGFDYFRGQNVRGVYFKALQTSANRYAAINLLNQFTAQTGICLPRTVQYLVARVKRSFVPLYENEDSGIRAPLSIAEPRVVKGLFHYRPLRPHRKAILIGDDSFLIPIGQKERMFNPSGLYLAFLHGSVRDYEINVRLDVVFHSPKSVLTPLWDYEPPALGLPLRCNKIDFARAVYFNLSL